MILHTKLKNGSDKNMVKKWYLKKYALQKVKQHPTYYNKRKLVKTTKIDWDGNKRPAWKFVKKQR